jgi:hypothetical protein
VAIFAAYRETVSLFQGKYLANVAIYRVEGVLRRIINREIVRSGQNGKTARRKGGSGKDVKHGELGREHGEMIR